MIRFASVVLLLAGLSVFSGEGPPASRQDANARVWVGRHQEIEETLRTAECMTRQLLGANGPVRCTLRPGGPVARMLWKAWPPGVHRGFRESYKSEIAAYELDKLLMLNMVPPTVERQLDGNTGAAQLWLEGVVAESAGASPAEPNQTRADQLARMNMFDVLIGNPDRNLANMLHDKAGNLFLVDHSRAFGTDAGRPYKLSRIDRGLWTTIERLTRTQLDAVLKAWLGDDEIRAVLGRRDKMRAEIRLLPL